MNFMKHHFRHPALWISLGWILIAIIVYLSLAKVTINIPAENGDKYGHIAAYAAVMFWFMQIYEGTRSRLTVALSLLALGIGLEFVQAWTGYRSYERADMVADALGIAIGWVVAPPRTFHLLERIDKSV
jgi:VanZ family protein